MTDNMDDRRSTPADVSNAYRVLIGRPAESVAVCEEQSGPPVSDLIETFWSSAEFAEAVLGNLRHGIDGGDRFALSPLPRDVRWIANNFPLSEKKREELAYVASWPDLYRVLLTDPAFLGLVSGMALGWDPAELLRHLERWSRSFAASSKAEARADNHGPDNQHDADDPITAATLPLDFEPDIYRRYEDARNSPLGLAGHYRRIGFRQGRVYNTPMYDYRRGVLRNAIDSELYLSQRGPGLDPAGLVDDWIFHGSINNLQPAHDFSLAHYGDRYRDLTDLNVDLYEHYVVNGRNEGRLGSFIVDHFMHEGGKRWNLLAPTLILATHEASRTGAPILALALLKQFSKTHNVILLMPKGGELLEEFQAACVLYGVGYLELSDGKILLAALRERFLVEAIIINSVGTNYIAGPALVTDLPSVGLIHEFASYTKPVTQMIRMVEQLDVAVVPAALIAEQIDEEAVIYRGGSTSNVVICPQGYIQPEIMKPSKLDMTAEVIRNALNVTPGSDPAIVLGGGTVQMRKGVDLFIQTAAEIKRTSKRPVKFIWAGHGYDAENDQAYSVYLKYMVSALGLEKDLFFAPPQEQFGVMIGLADVFLVSSRQDPFPNVALDAFAADKPVVCFERATGIAEAIKAYGFAGGVAPFCDVHGAAALVSKYINHGALNGTNRAIIDEKFNFERYAQAILGYVEQAKKITEERRGLVERVQQTDCFDASFHENREVTKPGERSDAIRLYVARAQKGLLWRNPRPGFNEGTAHAEKPGQPGLISRMGEGAACPRTHRVINLDNYAKPRTPPRLRVALHFHLHYSDLAAEFAALCSHCDIKADIVISTSSQRGQIECQFAFRAFKGGDVHVVQVDNIGRDIDPLLREVPKIIDIDRYDLIGHLHGKRSSVLPEMGDRWRRFLVDALIGDRVYYGKLINLFADQPSLGMIFAEDSHSVGWGENLPFAEQVASRLTPAPVIPAYPIFPIGTMFWARPAALKSVWDEPDLLAGLPGEPLPYDGTILHAFERLLPAIVESNGYDWSTVYRAGSGW